jgi:hypothetical protein
LLITVILAAKIDTLRICLISHQRIGHAEVGPLQRPAQGLPDHRYASLTCREAFGRLLSRGTHPAILFLEKDFRAKSACVLNLFLGPGPHIDDCFVRYDIDRMQRSQPIALIKHILLEKVATVRRFLSASPREGGCETTGHSRGTAVVMDVLQRAQTGKRIAGVIRIRTPTWHLSARSASQTFAGDLLRRFVS